MVYNLLVVNSKKKNANLIVMTFLTCKRKLFLNWEFRKKSPFCIFTILSGHIRVILHDNTVTAFSKISQYIFVKYIALILHLDAVNLDAVLLNIIK